MSFTPARPLRYLTEEGFEAAYQPEAPLKGELRLSKKSDFVIARPLAAVAISQNCFDILEDFGEFGTACMRLPRRFAPRNDTNGSFLTHSRLPHPREPFWAVKTFDLSL